MVKILEGGEYQANQVRLVFTYTGRLNPPLTVIQYRPASVRATRTTPRAPSVLAGKFSSAQWHVGTGTRHEIKSWQ